MSLSCSDFERIIENLLPRELAVFGDFYGWVNGKPKDIAKVAVVVDVLNKDLRGYDCIVSHHYPVRDCSIPIFVVHTPLDRASWGTNYELAKLYKLEDRQKASEKGFGIIGHRKVGAMEILKESIENFAVSPRFRIKRSSYEKIAVFSGCGFLYEPFLNACIRKKVDLIISGDLTHKVALRLANEDIDFIDITHYASEVPGVKRLAKELSKFVEAEFVDVGAPFTDFFFR